ncbi:tetratricopeptide repeat protein [Candidatus Sumerlaeota bacterium]|nr:tetratricopeptide repeat protein [Candidatus Sumerlaeota bacterium]
MAMSPQDRRFEFRARRAIRAAVSRSMRWGVVAVVLSGLAAGCSRSNASFVIPRQSTAQAQFLYAEELGKRFYASLNPRHRVFLGEQALTAYRKVIDEFPDDKTFVNRSWLASAMIYEKEGQLRKALRIHKRLVRDAAEDATVHASALYGAALVYDALGKPEKALSYYDQVVSRYGESEDPVLSGIAKRARWRYQQVRAK